MTKLLRFTPAARADLAEIWDYTARNWDMDQADRYLDALHGICLSLAAGDTVSRPVDLRPGIRKARAGSHMAYVREGADTIDVIRILHQRQDVERHLQLFILARMECSNPPEIRRQIGRSVTLGWQRSQNCRNDRRGTYL